MIGGRTTIAPDVLLTIAGLTALNVDGVSRLADTPSKVNRFLKKSHTVGVEIDINNDCVYASLYVILENDVNMREVSRNIQNQVARAISEMVGMRVGRVNVHIEDIDYPGVSLT